MQKADLHIHTTASDGMLAPHEVVAWAAKKKLKAIAVTDHDTIKGIQPALEISGSYDIEIIPGIELSALHQEDEIHILGYFIDYQKDWLKKKLEDMYQSRYVRAVKMVEKLQEVGLEISLEQVKSIAESGTIGRPHIARALMEKGYISCLKEAFDRYIGKNGPAYVERYRITCKEAIDMIHRLGGVPVMAHPGLIKNKECIDEILDMGIEGMEVYHTKHDEETIRSSYLKANGRGLLITGGSDCHGIFVNNEPILGNIWVDYKYVQLLKEKAQNKKQYNGGPTMELKISDKISKIAPSITLAIDAKLKQMIADGIKVYGFGAGEPDFDTPKYIRDAAIKAIEDGFTRYTAAQGTLDLRKAVCAKMKRDHGLDYNPSQVIASSGAKHSLSNAFAAILNPGDEVIVPVPYWVSYTEIIKLNDGIPVLVPTKKENNFKMTKAELEAVLTPKTKAILINTPNNPTGSLYSEAEFRDIAEVAVAHRLYVVSDEIYEQLTYDGKKHVSIASLGEDIKTLTVVINGMSKAYAMTGWRLGYACADEKLVKAMSSVQSHAVSHPSSITQYAATVALNGPQDDVHKMVEQFAKRRTYMFERLNQMEGLECLMPEGAFYIYVDITHYMNRQLCGQTIKSSLDFAQILLEQGHVAVIPGAAFGTDNFIRLSYATSMETIENGLNAFESFIKENLK
jgi:aspartate aminotransferase